MSRESDTRRKLRLESEQRFKATADAFEEAASHFRAAATFMGRSSDAPHLRRDDKRRWVKELEKANAALAKVNQWDEEHGE